MKPVWIGNGISETLAAELRALVLDLKTHSKNPAWRLHVEALGGHQYNLQVYAPDLHTNVHTVTSEAKVLESVHEILLAEGQSWRFRVNLALAQSRYSEARSKALRLGTPLKVG